MRPGAGSLEGQLVVGILGPPIMASLVWMMSRGWAHTVQGDLVSDETKRRQKTEFWIVLGVMYFLVFAITIYDWLT